MYIITFRYIGRVGSVWNFVLVPASISSTATHIVKPLFIQIQGGNKKKLLHSEAYIYIYIPGNYNYFTWYLCVLVENGKKKYVVVLF